LLAVVLGIWGTIGYKIINGISSDAPPLALQEFDNTFKPKSVVEAEAFSIQHIERDPFLGTLTSTKKKKTTVISNNAPKPNVTNKIITYSGLIQKQTTTDQVFVINIDNNQYLLKKGQTADDIKLVRGNAKQIVIRYNNKLQTIKRQ
jgi:hypothetical protein